MGEARTKPESEGHGGGAPEPGQRRAGVREAHRRVISGFLNRPLGASVSSSVKWTPDGHSLKCFPTGIVEFKTKLLGVGQLRGKDAVLSTPQSKSKSHGHMIIPGRRSYPTSGSRD